MRNDDRLIELLQELVFARGPCGQEDEVRVICQRELAKYADKVWVDEAGNAIGLVRASPSRKSGGIQPSPVRLMAHMDEIGMIVKRVDPDGTLRVANLGGMRPGCFGQGPVDILADSAVLPGVLSLGSQHSTKETANVEETRTKAIEWAHVHVFTGRTPKELKRIGVHAGTRVAIARDRRKLLEMGDCVAGYFLDDRAAIAALLAVVEELATGKRRPAYDVYFVMTVEEERSSSGAVYASRRLPGETTIVIEIGPICREYGTEFRRDPIIAYGDSSGLFTRSLADELADCSCRIGQNPQKAVWENFGSDASFSKAYGLAPRAGLISIPTQNTHGYEIIPRASIRACADLVTAFLTGAQQRRNAS